MEPRASVLCRPARPEDAAGIAIVQAYTWLTTYTGLMPREAVDRRVSDLCQAAEMQKQAIENGNGFLVAEWGNAVVGYAMYGPSRWEDYPYDGEVYALYLLKGFQRSGIGRKLLTGCMDALRQAEHREMLVLCLQNNPALGFYQALGGTVVGQRRDRVPGGEITEDMIRFKLS